MTIHYTLHSMGLQALEPLHSPPQSLAHLLLIPGLHVLHPCSWGFEKWVTLRSYGRRETRGKQPHWVGSGLGIKYIYQILDAIRLTSLQTLRQAHLAALSKIRLTLSPSPCFISFIVLISFWTCTILCLFSCLQKTSGPQTLAISRWSPIWERTDQWNPFVYTHFRNVIRKILTAILSNF